MSIEHIRLPGFAPPCFAGTRAFVLGVDGSARPFTTGFAYGFSAGMWERTGCASGSSPCVYRLSPGTGRGRSGRWITLSR